MSESKTADSDEFVLINKSGLQKYVSDIWNKLWPIALKKAREEVNNEVLKIKLARKKRDDSKNAVTGRYVRVDSKNGKVSIVNDDPPLVNYDILMKEIRGIDGVGKVKFNFSGTSGKTGSPSSIINKKPTIGTTKKCRPKK